MGLFGGGGVVTTQQHLDIEDIVDDLVILKNGTVSLILETTAVNFDLLSEEEQDAKILSFAGVLNSLTFPLQIIVNTTQKDVTSYIEKLELHKQKQISEGLKRQIEIYIQFIKNLTVKNEVLDKRFFVAIPSVSSQVQKTSLIKQFFGKPSKITNLSRLIEKAKQQLYPKRDHIMKQLKKMQIESRQLDTDELIRLFHSLYDPDRIGLERLNIRSEDLRIGMVSPLTDENQKKLDARQQKINDNNK